MAWIFENVSDMALIRVSPRATYTRVESVFHRK